VSENLSLFDLSDNTGQLGLEMSRHSVGQIDVVNMEFLEAQTLT